MCNLNINQIYLQTLCQTWCCANSKDVRGLISEMGGRGEVLVGNFEAGYIVPSSICSWFKVEVAASR